MSVTQTRPRHLAGLDHARRVTRDMRVILRTYRRAIGACGPGGWEDPHVHFDPCLIRFVTRSGALRVRLGVPLLDEFLEFVGSRCRPNTVLATALDLTRAQMLGG